MRLETRKLLLQSLAFLLLGLSFRNESALLSIADLGQASGIDGKPGHIREIYVIVTILLCEEAGALRQKRRTVDFQDSNAFVRLEQIPTRAALLGRTDATSARNSREHRFPLSVRIVAGCPHHAKYVDRTKLRDLHADHWAPNISLLQQTTDALLELAQGKIGRRNVPNDRQPDITILVDGCFAG